MTDGSVGFCIFYDWLEVFELLDKGDVADLVFAIGKHYTEGVDIVNAVSDRIKPIAIMIAKQLERAKKRSDKRLTFSAKKNVNRSAFSERKEKTDTNTETENKTKTETITDTNTETETEKNKETKPNPRVCVGVASSGGDFGGGEREEQGISDKGVLRVAEPPTLEEVERYARECGLKFVNTRQFFDYNERRGWVIEGEAVRDWQSLISIWNAKDTPTREASENGGKRYGGFDVNEAFLRGLERSYGEGK